MSLAEDETHRQEVTERQRAEEIFRRLLESAPDSMVIVDREGRIALVNAQTEKLFGYTRDELIGQPVELLVPGRFRESHLRHRAAYAAGPWVRGMRTGNDLSARRKDGTEFPAEISLSPLETEEGFFVSSAIRDITDRKRLQEELTRQRDALLDTSTFLNSILESSTEHSIIAKELDGKILSWNEGAVRTYGYTAEEMVGHNSEILHVAEDLVSGKVAAAFAAAREAGKFEGQFQRVRKNGQRFPAQVAITLRRNGSGEPVGYVLISKDISEQKALEQKLQRKNEEIVDQYRRLQEANRLKGEFLANMSHELRTPLNAIMGFAELMHDGKVGPVSSEHKEYLGDILTSSRHLLQLINDVLDLAKVESGKMEFRPEPVDLAALVGEACDILRPLAAQKQIAVETFIDSSLGKVLADPGRLKQVLYNYLSNALKFTSNGGRVWVRAVPDSPDAYRIEVEDTGIGIRREQLRRLFGQFQQLDAGTAKKYAGTGLGLALCRRIVEAQGGRVGVRSIPEKGSLFWAAFPRVRR